MTKLELLPIVFATGIALYITLIDLRELRIPNRILLPGLSITLVVMLSVSLVEQQISQFFLALLGGISSVAIFFCIHLVSPKGLGMGDVKFAGLIGAALSWISFPSGLLGLGIAFVISACFSTFIFIFRNSKFKRVIPFAPFMLLGLIFMEYQFIFSSVLTSKFSA